MAGRILNLSVDGVVSVTSLLIHLVLNSPNLER